MIRKIITTSILVLLMLITISAKNKFYNIHLKGWGPIKFGMTKAKIEKILNTKLQVLFNDDDYLCKTYTLTNSNVKIRFMFTKENKNQKFKFSRIYIYDKRIKTKSQIGIGDSKEKIIKKYGKKIHLKKHFYTGDENLVFIPIDEKDKKYRIIFETDNKIVTRYSVGKLPEIQWVEGCL